MKERFDRLSSACSEAITRLYSTSFSLGITFLSKELRQPIYAIYGFVRLADEIVDSFHDYDKPYLLNKFKQDCFEAIDHCISLNPVLNSFQAAVHNYNIDIELIRLFFKSMEMDLHKQDYTPETYERYILGSAQVVGLMCLQVFTGGNKLEYDKLKVPAMKLGAAFQKVNFLRDLNADYLELGRTYFPGIEVAKFTTADKRQIEQEITEDFNQALQGIRSLPASSRKGVYLAFIYYRKLFIKIKKAETDKVLNQRIRISNSHKCLLMIDSMIRYKLNVI
jgi:phytoene synthase